MFVTELGGGSFSPSSPLVSCSQRTALNEYDFGVYQWSLQEL